MAIIAIVTTIDSAELARAIADTLVERKLAACVHISEIDSVYSWQGAVQHDREFRVIAKTLQSHYGEVQAAIGELHSYEVPAIYAVPLTDVFAPYADWVAESVTDLSV